MDKKFLTSKPWIDLAKKHGITAPNLVKALTAHEKVANDYRREVIEDRLKHLEVILKCATDLKKMPPIAKLKDVVKYLDDMHKAAEEEKRRLNDYLKDMAAKEAAAKKAALPAKPKTPPQPDPMMLLDAQHIGEDDGFGGLDRGRKLFPNAKPFLDAYNKGFKDGVKNLAKGPPTTMGKISKEEWEKSVKYTQRKKLRKEFVQYLNEQWSTVLPEDL